MLQMHIIYMILNMFDASNAAREVCRDRIKNNNS